MPEMESFDSNCITPGTEFMHRLGIAFRRWIQYKQETDSFWRQVRLTSIARGWIVNRVVCMYAEVLKTISIYMHLCMYLCMEVLKALSVCIVCFYVYVCIHKKLLLFICYYLFAGRIIRLFVRLYILYVCMYICMYASMHAKSFVVVRYASFVITQYILLYVMSMVDLTSERRGDRLFRTRCARRGRAQGDGHDSRAAAPRRREAAICVRCPAICYTRLHIYMHTYIHTHTSINCQP